MFLSVTRKFTDEYSYLSSGCPRVGRVHVNQRVSDEVDELKTKIPFSEIIEYPQKQTRSLNPRHFSAIVQYRMIKGKK